MRPLLRIQLLTGILTMLAAAGVLWLNLMPQPTGQVFLYSHYPEENSTEPTLFVISEELRYGWPFEMKRSQMGPDPELDWRRGFRVAAQMPEHKLERFTGTSADSVTDTALKLKNPGPRIKRLPRETVLGVGEWNLENAAWNGGIGVVALLVFLPLAEFLMRRVRKLS